ncbi:MAG: archease [Alphaproteobacteria bacterium]|nr:archease [Alphaproteobacteria bacterium]
MRSWGLVAGATTLAGTLEDPLLRVPWETFPHGSDVGVRGYGRTPAEAFAHAAMALTSVITDPAAIRPTRRIEIACAAPDREILLLDWLNRLIAAMATEEMLFGRFEVAIEDDHLDATAFGEAIDPARHKPAVEVKGATFTELGVTRQPDGRWRAQCVVDV